MGRRCKDAPFRAHPSGRRQAVSRGVLCTRATEDAAARRPAVVALTVQQRNELGALAF